MNHEISPPREKNRIVNEIFSSYCTYRLVLMRDLKHHFDLIKKAKYEAVDTGADPIGAAVMSKVNQDAHP